MSIWDSLFGRRSLTLADPGGWNFAQSKSASGKSVTPDSAMQLATAWACVRLKSRTVGTLPIAVYEKLADGTRKEASDHWLYALVHDSPNADQTAAEFWQGVVACVDLWGNAYAEKDVASDGRVISLTPMRSDRTSVYRDFTGARRYRYSDPWGRTQDWGEDKVFHVRGFTVGGDVGLSAISYGRQTLGSSMAADEAAAKVFANGLMASGFTQPAVGSKSTSEQRAEMMGLFQKFAGSSQAGRVMPLPDGWTFEQVSMNPDDAQLLQTRSFNVEEICRWFDVLPVLVGHAAAGQTMWGSGIEQLMIGWLTLNLQPLLASVEQAIEKQLLPANMRRNIYPEFNLEGLLRADSAGRAALYSVQAQNGLKTRNEMRRRENDPPMPGGDVLTVQSNLTPLAKLGLSTPTPTPEGFGLPPKPPLPAAAGSANPGN